MEQSPKSSATNHHHYHHHHQLANLQLDPPTCDFAENLRSLQLAQAQAARLRALHSAIVNGCAMNREIVGLNPAANPVPGLGSATINRRISEHVLGPKPNQGVLLIRAASPGSVDRDREYPVFEPAGDRLAHVEAGRDSMGSSSDQSLITAEERISYILDHENRGALIPGIARPPISANHGRKTGNHGAISGRDDEMQKKLATNYSGSSRRPVKALSELLREEVMAKKKQLQEAQRLRQQKISRDGDGDDDRGSKHLQIDAGTETLQIDRRQYGSPLLTSSAKIIMKQVSDQIAVTGKSCKPAAVNLSRSIVNNDPQNHHQNHPQNHHHHHHRDGDAATIPDAIRAKPGAIRAKPGAIKPSINPIKAAWLSIRGNLHLINGRSTTTMKTSAEKSKSAAAARETSLDSEAESVISATSHTISAANRSINAHNYSSSPASCKASLDEQQQIFKESAPNHLRSRQKQLLHGQFSSHSARHDHHHRPPPPPPPPRLSPDPYYCRELEDQLILDLPQADWAPHPQMTMIGSTRPAPCRVMSSGLMNGAAAEREMAAAMAMDAMQARLMEARWRRDEAIAEMEEMRAALEEQRMAMAMAKLRGRGAAAAGEKQRRR